MGNGKFVFQLGNAALDKTLAFFGGFVFGVFGQIAVRSGFGNRFDHFGARHAFKLLQFLFQQFRTAYSQGDFLHKIVFSMFRHTSLRQEASRVPSCFVCSDIKIKTQAARKIGGLSIVEQRLFYQIL